MPSGLASGTLAVIVFFFLPWVGIVAGIVAAILLVLFLFGVGRGVTQRRPA